MKYVLRHGREKRAHIQASSNPRIGAAKEEQKHAKFLHRLQVFIPTSSPSIPKHWRTYRVARVCPGIP
jgi:hypothetical protein